MPVHMQVKLLRVIEEKQVWALGSTKPLLIRHPHHRKHQPRSRQEVEAGRFRCDLFYRLNVVHIVLPPLREHREDIPLLVEHFVRQFNLKLSRRVVGVDPEAMRVLMSNPWKGNVRELEHVIESAMVQSEGEVLTVGDLPRGFVGGPTPQSDSLREESRQSERQHIMRFWPRPGSTSAKQPVSWGSVLPRSIGARRSPDRRLHLAELRKIPSCFLIFENDSRSRAGAL